MKKPPLKAFGRSLSDFKPLFYAYPAEKKLLEACRIGGVANISKQRPDKPTKKNTVRASFVRFLALGGDEYAPVHEIGVILHGAWVVGELDMDSAILPHDLGLSRCHLSNIILRNSKAHGAVSFHGCYVNHLIANHMNCSNSVFLNNGFIATGRVSLQGVQIGCDLICAEGEFHGKDDDGVVLSCYGAVIKGDVSLSRGFAATGAVNLFGVQIGGSLCCFDAAIINDKTDGALICNRAVIKGVVLLTGSFTATVRLTGALIGGNLHCDNGKFDGKNCDALSCNDAVINGNVFLGSGFTATGTVRLNDAKIGSNLDCEAGKFDGKGGYALNCEGAVIKGSVYLRKGFTATGTVILSGAQIVRNLECFEATLDDGKSGRALIAESMTVAGIFYFRISEVVGDVSLVSTKVGSLLDDITSWSGSLGLDGFVYDRLLTTPTNALNRLEWLNKQPTSYSGLGDTEKKFKPQPWQQLQKVLREMGHIEDARQVAIEFEKRLYEADLIGQSPEDWCKLRRSATKWISRCFHWCFGWLIGYGYRPLRLFIYVFVIWLACGAFYSYAAYEGVFAPSNPLVFQNLKYDICTKAEILEFECTPKPNWYLCSELREEYTGFSPFLYSLDLILPLVDLQQEHDWSPMIPTPKNTWLGELKSWEFPKHITRLVMWFEILFGWMASLLLVAVVSGLTKRREE